MFDLGYKQIVINSDSVVVDNGGIIEIEGFGKFDPAMTSGALGAPWEGFDQPSVAPALGKYTVNVPAGTTVANETYDVKLYFSEAGRPLSEFFPSYIGEVMTLQSSVLRADDTLGIHMEGDPTATPPIKGAMIDAFNDKIFTITDGGANTFVIEFLPGYEGIGIQQIDIIASRDQVMVAPYVDFSEDTAPSEGIGQGKQIETEVRNATFDNIDPYGVQFGGNTAVDVRGTYRTIHWYAKASAEGINGWEPHDMLGYGDANTETLYAPVKFVAYVNEVSATAAAGLIAGLI